MEVADPVFHRRLPAFAPVGDVFDQGTRRHAEFLGHRDGFTGEPTTTLGVVPGYLF